LIGSYSIGNNTGDVIIMLIFGILGYLMKKFGYDGAPMVLGLVLGPMLEESFRESLMLSRGDFSIFISRPVSIGFLVVAFLLLIIPIITQRKRLSTLEES
jgi:putative tricarboxylic transport membrane protein